MQTLESDGPGLNLSSITQLLCDLAPVTFPLWASVFLNCKMGKIIEFTTYRYT